MGNPRRRSSRHSERSIGQESNQTSVQSERNASEVAGNSGLKKVKRFVLDSDVFTGLKSTEGGRVKLEHSVLALQKEKCNGSQPNVNCRVENFGKICASFDQRKREWVHEMGFQGLLYLSGKGLPRKLCYWLMTRVDPFRKVLMLPGCGDYPLSKTQVHWVLGIPVGHKRVPKRVVDDAMKAEYEFILNTYEKVYNGGTKGIPMPDVISMVEADCDVQDEKKWKSAFLMLCLCYVLAPSTSSRLGSELVPAVTVSMDAKQYDWADLVLDKLLQAVVSFADRFYRHGFAKGCGGCTYFLAIMYLDKLNVSPPVHWNVFPRIKAWKNVDVQRVRRLDSFDGPGDYGKIGCLDVAYGEKHPLVARDTMGPDSMAYEIARLVLSGMGVDVQVQNEHCEDNFYHHSDLDFEVNVKRRRTGPKMNPHEHRLAKKRGKGVQTHDSPHVTSSNKSSSHEQSLNTNAYIHEDDAANASLHDDLAANASGTVEGGEHGAIHQKSQDEAVHVENQVDKVGVNVGGESSTPSKFKDGDDGGDGNVVNELELVEPLDRIVDLVQRGLTSAPGSNTFTSSQTYSWGGSWNWDKKKGQGQPSVSTGSKNFETKSFDKPNVKVAEQLQEMGRSNSVPMSDGIVNTTSTYSDDTLMTPLDVKRVSVDTNTLIKSRTRRGIRRSVRLADSTFHFFPVPQRYQKVKQKICKYVLQNGCQPQDHDRADIILLKCKGVYATVHNCATVISSKLGGIDDNYVRTVASLYSNVWRNKFKNGSIRYMMDPIFAIQLQLEQGPSSEWAACRRHSATAAKRLGDTPATRIFVVFVPILEHDHWWCAAFSYNSQEVWVMDSNSDTPLDAHSNFLDKLSDAVDIFMHTLDSTWVKGHICTWTRKVVALEQQDDSWTCGVRMLLAIKSCAYRYHPKFKLTRSVKDASMGLLVDDLMSEENESLTTVKELC